MTNTTTMTPDQMQAIIDGLKRENANLKAKKAANGLRVSEKGALSVYGLGRFPVTLYREQWEKLFAMKAEIEAFITANANALTVKSKADETVN